MHIQSVAPASLVGGRHRPLSSQGPALALVLGYGRLHILSPFLNKGPVFPLCVGLHKLCSRSSAGHRARLMAGTPQRSAAATGILSLLQRFFPPKTVLSSYNLTGVGEGPSCV